MAVAKLCVCILLPSEKNWHWALDHIVIRCVIIKLVYHNKHAMCNCLSVSDDLYCILKYKTCRPCDHFLNKRPHDKWLVKMLCCIWYSILWINTYRLILYEENSVCFSSFLRRFQLECTTDCTKWKCGKGGLPILYTLYNRVRYLTISCFPSPGCKYKFTGTRPYC